jgi:hypothetical protein
MALNVSAGPLRPLGEGWSQRCADALDQAIRSTAYHCEIQSSQGPPKRPELPSQLQSPHSPIGRGSGLKIL